MTTKELKKIDLQYGFYIEEDFTSSDTGRTCSTRQAWRLKHQSKKVWGDNSGLMRKGAWFKTKKDATNKLQRWIDMVEGKIDLSDTGDSFLRYLVRTFTTYHAKAPMAELEKRKKEEEEKKAASDKAELERQNFQENVRDTLRAAGYSEQAVRRVFAKNKGEWC